MKSPRINREGTPLCFSSPTKFWEWNEFALRTDSVGSSSFCTDCTPEYKAKMIAEHRCQFPKTYFKIDMDGALAGVRITSDKLAPTFKRLAFPHPEGKVVKLGYVRDVVSEMRSEDTGRHEAEEYIESVNVSVRTFKWDDDRGSNDYDEMR